MSAPSVKVPANSETLIAFMVAEGARFGGFRFTKPVLLLEVFVGVDLMAVAYGDARSRGDKPILPLPMDPVTELLTAPKQVPLGYQVRAKIRTTEECEAEVVTVDGALSANETVALVHEIGFSVTQFIGVQYPDVPIDICIIGLLDAARNFIEVAAIHQGKPQTEVECLEKLEGIVASMRAGEQSGQVLPVPAKA